MLDMLDTLGTRGGSVTGAGSVEAVPPSADSVSEGSRDPKRSRLTAADDVLRDDDALLAVR
jgi:hypothetical protein